MKRLHVTLGIGMTCAALASCATQPSPSTTAPLVPPKWSRTPDVSGPVPQATVQWWKTFNDPELDSLIARATQSNLTVQLAQSRVREARAALERSSTSFWPTLSLGASYARERDSANAPSQVLVKPNGQFDVKGGDTENLYQSGFDASWEVGYFGGRRRFTLAAAHAKIASAVDDRGAVTLTLLGELARNYIELRELQQTLAIARTDLKSQQDTLHLIEVRQAGGLGGDLDVALADAQIKSLAAQLPALEGAIDKAAHRIAVLCGQAPVALATELASVGPIPTSDAHPGLGLPSDLLQRRPDIQRARYKVAEAAAQVGLARSALYPQFVIGAALGQSSVELGNFFDGASTYWKIGPSLSWPILQHGAIVATIKIRDAHAQQALLAYRQTILQALEEVEDSLAAYTHAHDRERALAATERAARRVVTLSRSRFLAGLAGLGDVLDAQRTLFQVQSQYLRSQADRSLALVALYKSLGGGWNATSLSTTTGSRATATRQQ